MPDFYLVGGTHMEGREIARERGIDPRSIRLVQSYDDIMGHRGGTIIFGHTGSHDDLSEIVSYAVTHDITVP